VPGEDLDTWARRVRAKAVVDPVLLNEERARQKKARGQFATRSQQRVRGTVKWLIASLLALVIFVILNQVAGLTGWLIAASAVAVIASAGASVGLGRHAAQSHQAARQVRRRSRGESR
jgi:cobalamin biosynthesis protein CobD/CbiB